MGKKKKIRKELIAEDWCFVCKDGGTLMVCEYKDCLKAYHTECVGKDDSFLETGENWACGWHYCFICYKISKFQCFCCPTAVCGRCLCDAEFAVVKGNKGFCRHCLKLALLIEENSDADSDGGKIDFNDRETYECLFAEYYSIIKEKEALNSLHLCSAHTLLKKGKNYKFDLDQSEIGVGEEESYEVISDYDEMSDTEEINSVGKRKKCMKEKCMKEKSFKEKVSYKKKDFLGWGSRRLIEFLEHIGKDTSKEYSQHDVVSIIIKYCQAQKLFNQVDKKKNKVLCDEKLRSLFGRKSVNRKGIYNLLTSHFAENLEDIEDDITSSSEDKNEDVSINCTKQRKLSSITKSEEHLISDKCQSRFAAIVSSNIKLVYLKRNLLEELLKQPETFDNKVMGCFVRVKSDPNDYLQKNSHQLLQVIGIRRASSNDETNKEVLLQLSDVPKAVPIYKISDDDFSEEECKDLHNRIKDGLTLIKQPTVVELQQKAGILHEDVTKHWIMRELALLQNRIDQANEKGWRKELFEYMDRKLVLETPSEQARLLQDGPKVIPEVVDIKLPQEDSPKLEQDDWPELALEETNKTTGNNSKGSSSACYLNNGTDAAGEKTPVETYQDGSAIPAPVEQLYVSTPTVQDIGTLPIKQLRSSSEVMQCDSNAIPTKELTLKSLIHNPAKCSLSRSRKWDKSMKAEQKIDSGSDVNSRKWDKNMMAEQKIDPGSEINSRNWDKKAEQKIEKRKQSVSIAPVIELSDEDEYDAHIPVGKQAVENTELSIWHCVGPCGEKRGPLSMSLLKRWSEASSYALKFKVWKTGQNEEEAIFLPDALRRIFPDI